MYCSFTLPALLQRRGEGRDAQPPAAGAGGGIMDFRYVFTTLGCPMIIQLFTTVMHIHAFDVYNRPEAVGWASRVEVVRNKYVPSVSQRMARVLAAYGCGNLLNVYLRDSLHSSCSTGRL